MNMNIAAIAKRVPGPARVGVAVWLVCGLLPALLTAARGSASPDGSRELVKRLLGWEVAGYLGYAPDAFIAFVLPSLVICPLLLLLFAVAYRASAGSPAQRALSIALKAWAWWAALAVVGLGVVFVVLALTRGHASIQLGWSMRLTIRLTVSALPSLGIVTAIVMLARSRRRAILIGVVTTTVLGYAGVIAPVREQGWLPAGVDQALFSGRPGTSAVVGVVAWLAAGLVVVTILTIRERPRRVTAR